MTTQNKVIFGLGCMLLMFSIMACSLLSPQTPTPITPITVTTTSSPTQGDGDVALADLIVHIRVSMAGYRGACIEAYTDLTTELCVENRGDGDAGPFDIQAGERGAWAVDGLNARDTHCIHVADNLSGIEVVVDSQNVVVEADEGNNAWIAPVPTPPVLCTSTPDAPTETPTAVTQPDTATPTPTPQPDTATPTLTPQPDTPAAPPTSLPLAIKSFTIEVASAPEGGKHMTFRWATTGATHVQLVSGTQHRFPLWWSNLDPNGEFEYNFSSTHFADPPMTLTAYNAAGEEVSETRIIEWPCKYSYFFDNPPDACPLYPATLTDAAEQHFEHGWMVWMRELVIGDDVTGGVIFVFYNDGGYERWDDTWDESQPTHDPSIKPPTGLQQPMRGFGKLWRDNDEIRTRLGWAVDSEVAFPGAWQPRLSESLPSIAFLLVQDGRVIRTYDWERGNWEVYSWP